MVVEHLPGMCEALDLMPTPKDKKAKNGKKLKRKKIPKEKRVL
jgi:hypothetical protein